MGTQDANIYVVPNGVDIEKFRLPDKNKKVLQGIGLENSFIVGFVGALMPRHSLEVLIEVAEDLKHKTGLSLKYLIIGEGRRENKLKNMVEHYNLEEDFVFLKNIRHEDIHAYINVMDVCILPNTSIYTSPIKIFEYMVMGKPIIAPRKGQVKEIIEDEEEGILIMPANKEELKMAIIRLHEDKKLRETMGKKAREKVERNYTWKHSAEKIMQIYYSFKK